MIYQMVYEKAHGMLVPPSYSRGLYYIFIIFISISVLISSNLHLLLSSAPGKLILNRKFMNQNFKSFLEIMETFLLEAAPGKPPLTCCLAVAGPVKCNRVKFTNRDDWSIDGETLANHFGISKVRIVNDFLSVGYGILTLDESSDCKLLQVIIKYHI